MSFDIFNDRNRDFNKFITMSDVQVRTVPYIIDINRTKIM